MGRGHGRAPLSRVSDLFPFVKAFSSSENKPPPPARASTATFSITGNHRRRCYSGECALMVGGNLRPNHAAALINLLSATLRTENTPGKSKGETGNVESGEGRGLAARVEVRDVVFDPRRSPHADLMLRPACCDCSAALFRIIDPPASPVN